VQEIMEAGSKIDIKLEYEMTAIQAKADTKYKGDCTFKAFTIPRGPEIVLTPEDILTTPIEVIHIRRKESVSKHVVPAVEEAEYEIYLRFKNRGNNTLAEKILVDQCPENFEIVSMQPEGEIESIEEGIKISWVFKNIEPGDEIEAKYIIKGIGEFKAGKTAIFTQD
ncbi:MAG: hypothetical protein ACFFD2_27835, partial [Promethearchaeota archaeon]